MDTPQPFSFQSIPHSFYCNGGVYPPSRLPRAFSAKGHFPSLRFPISNLELRFLKSGGLHRSPDTGPITSVFATLTDSAPCKSFTCHSYENMGGVYHLFPFRNEFTPSEAEGPLAALTPSFVFILFRTLLHLFALTQDSTLLFSNDSELFAKNTRGGGRVLQTRNFSNTHRQETSAPTFFFSYNPPGCG